MKKLGILGGGQLGRMLLQAAANYPVETFVLENDPACPAASLCHHFILGDFRNYDDVLAFGRQVDVLTIEIEAINVDALETLEQEGKTIIPSPAVLRTIKNKVTQKAFYQQQAIPTPSFVVTHTLADLQQHTDKLPAVHKIGEGGYDGKGVQMLHSVADLPKGFDAPAVLEQKVDIATEIAVIAAADTTGKVVLYPPVEMVFDPVLNLLDYQVCPAQISKTALWKAEAIVMRLVKAFNSAGLFAVELLVDQQGEVWVNETAPRVHNSGHHSIEAHHSSQYDMLLRILLGYPLGSPEAISASALVNLIGEAGFSGPARYEGLETVLQMAGAYVHIYGKTHTKPGRKMGHVTVLGTDRTDLMRKARMIKEALKVIA